MKHIKKIFVLKNFQGKFQHKSGPSFRNHWGITDEVPVDRNEARLVYCIDPEVCVYQGNNLSELKIW